MISVVIPVYNAERFLTRTLESVRAQTYTDFEVLLVDDGSTDSSEAVMRRFADADPRFRIITRKNGGQSAARNTGIDAARGEWLYFIDADDTMHPRALEILLKAAHRTGVTFVIGGYFESEKEDWPEEPEAHRGQRVYTPLSASASEADPTPPRSPSASEAVFSAKEILTVTLYQHRRLNNVWGALISASVFRDNGLRFLEGMYYEDLLIFPFLCLHAGRIAYLPPTLYFYRQHPGSFIHTFSTRRLDSLQVTEEIVSLMEREMPDLVPAARDRRMSAAFNVLRLIAKHKPTGELPERYSRYGRNYGEVADYCWRLILEQRGRSLFDTHTRLKNRLGALVSFFGRRAVTLFC